MFKKSHYVYRDILLQNLLENNGGVWFDAGGGYNTGLNKEDYKLLKNIKLISSDRDEESLRKNKFADKLINCDLEKIPLKDNSVDIISLRMVAEHLENPEEVLKELSRILKIGGKLMIYTPNINNYLNFIAKHFPNFYKEKIKKKMWQMEEEDIYPGYYLLNRRDKIKSALKKYNLKEKKFYYIPAMASEKRNTIYYLEFLLVHILNILKIFNMNIIGIYEKYSLESD